MSELTARLDAIGARVDAAMPGPWQWYGNTKSRHIGLATTHSGRRFVMTFERWGMSGAQPNFQTDGLMNDCGAYARYEVCPDATDPADRRLYRHDFIGLRHPDAAFIAAARTDVPLLLAAVRAVLALHAPWRIYDDCGHRHTHEDVEAGKAKNISDVGCVCEDGYLYEICRECCRDGEHQTEACATDHDLPCYPCPTVAAITTALGGAA